MQPNRWTLLAAAVGSAVFTTLVVNLGLAASPTKAQPVPIDQQVPLLMAEQQAMKRALQRTQLMAVTYQLDTAGFHDLDERLSAGTFVPGALGRVRRARIATEAAEWPGVMEETVKTAVEQMRALEDALRDEDVQRAAGPAHEVHELTHQMSDMAYATLSVTTPQTDGN